MDLAIQAGHAPRLQAHISGENPSTAQRLFEKYQMSC